MTVIKMIQRRAWSMVLPASGQCCGAGRDSAAFKAKVAIEALADGKTIAEIAHKHDVHPS